ncbi:MAG: hypothetical protein H6651_12170 [Ardenticatenales bacterium]|nr:hypothetical protein [Ardenticatenales bacterium]
MGSGAGGDPAGWPAALAGLIRATRAGAHTPLAMQQHNLDFQITRGLLGISL